MIFFSSPFNLLGIVNCNKRRDISFFLCCLHSILLYRLLVKLLLPQKKKNETLKRRNGTIVDSMHVINVDSNFSFSFRCFLYSPCDNVAGANADENIMRKHIWNNYINRIIAAKLIIFLQHRRRRRSRLFLFTPRFLLRA